MNAQAQLTSRIKRAHGFFRDLLDLVEEQGWTYRAKDEGLLFFPPMEKRRPGFESVYASDPGNQSHQHKHIRDRFRKAGLVFPDESPPQRIPKPVMANAQIKPHAAVHSHSVATALEQPTADLVTQIRQKSSAIVTLLSEIEDLAGKLDKENEGARKLREALKGINY